MAKAQNSLRTELCTFDEFYVDKRKYSKAKTNPQAAFKIFRVLHSSVSEYLCLAVCVCDVVCASSVQRIESENVQLHMKMVVVKLNVAVDVLWHIDMPAPKLHSSKICWYNTVRRDQTCPEYDDE